MSNAIQRLKKVDGGVTELPASDGLPASVHVWSKDEILAINAALATGKALLLRGEPGTGKTQLGRAAAVELGRTFAYQAVDSRTETRDLLWTLDAIARLAEAQVLGTRDNVSEEERKKALDLSNYLQPGALWWAFRPSDAREQATKGGPGACVSTSQDKDANGAVALLDEIDKADPSVPNGLLDALGHGGFAVPGRQRVCVDSERPPLILLTTNEERGLSEAFLRRCLVLTLRFPEGDKLAPYLVKRGALHHPDLPESLLQEAAAMVARDRKELVAMGLAGPGLSEYLDLVAAVAGEGLTGEARATLLSDVGAFILRKHDRRPLR
jgi:MoxR-like ATPase